MTPANPVDHARQALNVLFAVGQIAASFIPDLTGYGRRLGEGEPGVTVNPAAPPGPAFAIWGCCSRLSSPTPSTRPHPTGRLNLSPTPIFANCFNTRARNAGASFDQSTFSCWCVTGARTYSVLIPSGASEGSLTTGTADWSVVGSAFTQTDAKLYLRFTEVEKVRRKFNIPAGRVVTFGSTSSPGPLYTGPTDRPIIRKMLADGEPVTATPERVAPGDSNAGQDVIGSANVQRGTRRCT